MALRQPPEPAPLIPTLIPTSIGRPVSLRPIDLETCPPLALSGVSLPAFPEPQIVPETLNLPFHRTSLFSLVRFPVWLTGSRLIPNASRMPRPVFSVFAEVLEDLTRQGPERVVDIPIAPARCCNAAIVHRMGARTVLQPPNRLPCCGVLLACSGIDQSMGD